MVVADGLFDVGGDGFLLGGLDDLVLVLEVDDDGMMDLSGFLFVDLVALEGIDKFFDCDCYGSQLASRWKRVQGACGVPSTVMSSDFNRCLICGPRSISSGKFVFNAQSGPRVIVLEAAIFVDLCYYTTYSSHENPCPDAK